MPPQTPRVRRIRNRQPGSSDAPEKSIHSVTVRSAVAAGHLAFAASGVRPDRGRPGPGQALRGFLDALGCRRRGSRRTWPRGPACSAACWRGKRVLVVLDNARSAEQAAVQLAARTGPSTRARQLAWALSIFLLRRGLWHDQTTACQAALDAARRAGDMTGEAHSLERLAAGYAKSGRIAQCQPLFEEALWLFEALGDHASRAHVHRALLWIAERQQRPVEMLSHAQRCYDLYRRADHRTGQAMASRPSAMRTPCSPTTARPSPISNDPWPRCRRWGNGPGRVPSGTASATSITIAVTSGKPSHATNGPSASPGSSPTVSTRPTH